MRVLVIAPHPDDETLGCGGTILKHISQGDSVSWLIVTKAHEPRWSAAVIARREEQIVSVSKAYGVERTFRLTLPTTMLDTMSLGDVIQAIAEVVKDATPDCVYTVHGGDVHSDHRIVFEATMSAVKSFNSSKHGVNRLLSYETISSTDGMPPSGARVFLPNVFNDISAHLERTLEIMKLYEGEVHTYPLPRSLESIRALARYRGATVGVEYAETFMLIREVS